jgi:hypothetical protein
MTLIATVTAASAQANLEFTAIPATATDLFLVVSVRSARAGQTDDDCLIEFNGSSANLSARELRGSGSAATSASRTIIPITFMPAATATSNTFANASVYIPNYSGSTNKSLSVDGVGENNATAAFQNITAGLWSSTSAITSILMKSATANNFVAGSTASLYAVTKGSGGATVS